MESETTHSARAHDFRTAMLEFINERRDAKLKTTKPDAVDAVHAKYEYATWLADAARRVSQIQSVTHVLKASHPDARGTNLLVLPEQLTQHEEIGTHSLPVAVEDVVGNAAALDVYKFLKLSVEGRSLLDWLLDDDPDLLVAMSDDRDDARALATAFKGLVRDPEEFASHQMAKQVYWSVSGEPSDNAGFHLLQPMFSSSLAHAVHQEIQAARFGEPNTQARQALREGSTHDGEYREYRNLMTRKLGGTKPQNISQLNSERGGVNYLLASLPPAWNRSRPRHFLFLDSAFQRFRYFEGVKTLIRDLIALLEGQPSPTAETRRRRESIEQRLGEAMVAFGLEASQSLMPGWSRDINCRLPLSERIWLDPGRADLPASDQYREQDEEFMRTFKLGAWPEDVANNYASWLNNILRDHHLPVGDVEHAHWAKRAMDDAGLMSANHLNDVIEPGGQSHA